MEIPVEFLERNRREGCEGLGISDWIEVQRRKLKNFETNHRLGFRRGKKERDLPETEREGGGFPACFCGYDYGC